VLCRANASPETGGLSGNRFRKGRKKKKRRKRFHHTSSVHSRIKESSDLLEGVSPIECVCCPELDVGPPEGDPGLRQTDEDVL